MHLIHGVKFSCVYLPRHECSPQGSPCTLLWLMISLKPEVMQGMQFLPPSLSFSHDTNSFKRSWRLKLSLER